MRLIINYNFHWKELKYFQFLFSFSTNIFVAPWANKIKMSLRWKSETVYIETQNCASSRFSRKITWRNLYLILFNLWCVSYCCHFHHHLWLSTPFQSLVKQWLLLLFLQFHIFISSLRSMFFQVGPIEKKTKKKTSHC